MAAAEHLAALPFKLPPAVEALAHQVYEGHLALQDVMSVDHNLIPHMEWEQQLATATSLSVDQTRFTLALFSGVLIAAGVRLFRNPTRECVWAWRWAPS